MIPRLIAEPSVHGYWECFAESDSGMAATGEEPLHAFRRLCELFGLPPRRYTIAEQAPNRVVFIHRDARRFDDPCPDCGGSGRYVGLNVVEDCGRCGGSGCVPR